MPIDYVRLAQAVNRSRLVLQPVRSRRLEMIKETAGDLYTEGLAEVKLNLLSLYKSIIGRALVAKDPRYSLATFDAAFRPVIDAEEDWLNEWVEKIELDETLRECVDDALYLVGICKVALATPCDSAMHAWEMQSGEPSASRVDFDDFIYDTAASSFDQCDFIGHRYLCPRDVALKLYGKRVKNLSAYESQANINKEGDWRPGTILRGAYSPETFEEYVELWELYLPRYKKVITVDGQDIDSVNDRGKAGPLWEQDWVGPPWGPYIFLGFEGVPGNALPKGPMMNLWHLHRDANNALRKGNRAVRNVKELTTYPSRSEQDALTIKNANDGDLVPVDNPEGIKPIVTRGNTAQMLHLMTSTYKDLFDFMGGNLSLLGGRAPQSKTATQDEMLNQNAGAGIQDLSSESVKFVAKVGESLWWFHHHHPKNTMKSRYEAAPGVELMRTVTPQMRHAIPWDRAKFRLDPYSLQHQSPQQKLAFLDSVVSQLIPIMPLLQQQGVMFDVHKYLEKKAKYGDSTDLLDIFSSQEPMQEDEGGETPSTHGQTLPAQTERTYTRRNVPQEQGADANNIAAQLANVDLGGKAASQMGAA